MIAGKNLVQARTLCQNLITKYPDYAVSYNALNLLKDTYPNDISSSVNCYYSIFNSKVKNNINAMAGLILADLDKGNKLSRINDVINNYQGQSIVENALFNKFVYYYFEKQDKQNYLNVSSQLDKLFPLSFGAIEAHRILGDAAFFKINAINEQYLQKTTNQTPTDFALVGNYPNPFNPSTTISYNIPEDGKVSIKVFDILGRLVSTLVNDVISAGTHSVLWNAAYYASGIYFYNVTFKNQTLYKKMLLIK
jgi:hypothetical protein